jgi:hypothetical protein
MLTSTTQQQLLRPKHKGKQKTNTKHNYMRMTHIAKLQQQLMREKMKQKQNIVSHTEIIVNGRKIAVESSMNTYSASTGRGLLEARLVSLESKIVDSVTKYIIGLLAKTESPDITSYSSNIS